MEYLNYLGSSGNKLSSISKEMKSNFFSNISDNAVNKHDELKFLILMREELLKYKLKVYYFYKWKNRALYNRDLIDEENPFIYNKNFDYQKFKKTQSHQINIDSINTNKIQNDDDINFNINNIQKDKNINNKGFDLFDFEEEPEIIKNDKNNINLDDINFSNNLSGQIDDKLGKLLNNKDLLKRDKSDSIKNNINIKNTNDRYNISENFQKDNEIIDFNDLLIPSNKNSSNIPEKNNANNEEEIINYDDLIVKSNSKNKNSINSIQDSINVLNIQKNINDALNNTNNLFNKITMQRNSSINDIKEKNNINLSNDENNNIISNNTYNIKSNNNNLKNYENKETIMNSNNINSFNDNLNKKSKSNIQNIGKKVSTNGNNYNIENNFDDKNYKLKNDNNNIIEVKSDLEKYKNISFNNGNNNYNTKTNIDSNIYNSKTLNNILKNSEYNFDKNKNYIINQMKNEKNTINDSKNEFEKLKNDDDIFPLNFLDKYQENNNENYEISNFDNNNKILNNNNDNNNNFIENRNKFNIIDKNLENNNINLKNDENKFEKNNQSFNISNNINNKINIINNIKNDNIKNNFDNSKKNYSINNNEKKSDNIIKEINDKSVQIMDDIYKINNNLENYNNRIINKKIKENIFNIKNNKKAKSNLFSKKQNNLNWENINKTNIKSNDNNKLLNKNKSNNFLKQNNTKSNNRLNRKFDKIKNNLISDTNKQQSSRSLKQNKDKNSSNINYSNKLKQITKEKFDLKNLFRLPAKTTNIEEKEKEKYKESKYLTKKYKNYLNTEENLNISKSRSKNKNNSLKNKKSSNKAINNNLFNNIIFNEKEKDIQIALNTDHDALKSLKNNNKFNNIPYNNKEVLTNRDINSDRRNIIIDNDINNLSKPKNSTYEEELLSNGFFGPKKSKKNKNEQNEDNHKIKEDNIYDSYNLKVQKLIEKYNNAKKLFNDNDLNQNYDYVRKYNKNEADIFGVNKSENILNINKNYLKDFNDDKIFHSKNIKKNKSQKINKNNSKNTIKSTKNKIDIEPNSKYTKSEYSIGIKNIIDNLDNKKTDKDLINKSNHFDYDDLINSINGTQKNIYKKIEKKVINKSFTNRGKNDYSTYSNLEENRNKSYVLSPMLGVPITNISFRARLKYFTNKREKEIKRMMEKKLEEEKQIYTFKPKTGYNKLNVIKYNNLNNIIGNLNASQYSLNETQRKVDIQRIHNLYLDYKDKKIKREELTKEYFKKEGITFTPTIRDKNKEIIKYKKKIGQMPYLDRIEVYNHNREIIRNKNNLKNYRTENNNKY